MKKKKVKIAALSLAVLVAGTGAFHAYGSYQQSGESNALLNENILALSSEGEGGFMGFVESLFDNRYVHGYRLAASSCRRKITYHKQSWMKGSLPEYENEYAVDLTGKVVLGVKAEQSVHLGEFEYHEDTYNDWQPIPGEYRWGVKECSTPTAWCRVKGALFSYACGLVLDTELQKTCTKSGPWNGTILDAPEWEKENK